MTNVSVVVTSTVDTMLVTPRVATVTGSVVVVVCMVVDIVIVVTGAATVIVVPVTPMQEHADE